jgi:opacity protein-like surface antigen
MLLLSAAGLILVTTVFQVIFVYESAANLQYDFWYVQYKVSSKDFSVEGPSRETDLQSSIKLENTFTLSHTQCCHYFPYALNAIQQHYVVGRGGGYFIGKKQKSNYNINARRSNEIKILFQDGS